MSTSAEGSVTSTSMTGFTATFFLPGSNKRVTFYGKLKVLVQTFKCSNAVLRYDNDTQLTDARQLNGQIGVDNLKLTLDNGAVFEGVLDMPISPASSVSGSGNWETKTGTIMSRIPVNGSSSVSFADSSMTPTKLTGHISERLIPPLRS
ncbi:hypothetical protein JR316_0007643 [Psilocybe cubensis]|uniref:Uncharacterized protein n=2 Tax=Psilocybe cubensis TaxID=181762 RepID=A0ACB8GV20_PSICU|nr:hypothetical protein JR316_0007643 [Psilocybe cubensis]KAH9479066.1 hypothetical protein JR316_0007643 [Psilocybe cubensis]